MVSLLSRLAIILVMCQLVIGQTQQVKNGGTGRNTLAAHGFLVGEGTSPINIITPGNDSVALWQASSSDPVATAFPNCGDSTHALAYSTSTHTFSCQSISGSGGTVTSINSTTPIVVSPNPITSTGTISCPTCVVNPPSSTIGGIMGIGSGNTGFAASTSQPLQPFTSSSSTSQRVPLPFEAWERNLAVSIPGSIANNTPVDLHFAVNESTNPNSANTQTNNTSDIGRLSVSQVAGAGVYHETSGVLPFHIGAGVGVYIMQIGWGVVNTGSGNFGTISWDLVGSNLQPLMWVGSTSQTVAASTTVWIGFGQGTGIEATTEQKVGIPIPYAGTLANVCIVTNTTQSATGTLTATLRYTHAGSTLSSSVVATVPLSGLAGQYCDLTDSQAVSAGDWVDIQVQNNATATSATIFSVVATLAPSGGATGMICFPRYANAYTAGGGNKYASPFSTSAQGSDLNSRGVAPRAFTAKNMYALYSGSPPGTNNLVLTLQQNGSNSLLATTVPTTGCTNQVCSDTIDTVSFAQWDNFSLFMNQSSGAVTTLSAACMEVD